MRLFVWELRKLFADRTALAGLALVAAVLTVALLGFASSGEPTGTLAEMRARGELALPPVYLKGLGFAFFSLPQVARTLLPFVLIVVFSSTFAGERQSGMLAETLARPVGRGSLLAAKFAAGAVYAAALVGAAALIAPGLSSLALGPGRLLLEGAAAVRDPATGAISFPDLPVSAAFGRFALAHLLMAFSLAPVVGLATLASAAAESPRTASLVAGGAYFGLLAASTVPGTGALRRYLLINHLEAWTGALSVNLNWAGILRSSSVIAVALALLLFASYLVLKDLLLPPRQEIR